MGTYAVRCAEMSGAAHCYDAEDEDDQESRGYDEKPHDFVPFWNSG